MDCPVCGERLRAVDRQGIEVDICPGCKGIWLDRGELDKLLDMAAERSSAPAPAAAPPQYAPPPPTIPAPPPPTVVPPPAARSDRDERSQRRDWDDDRRDRDDRDPRYARRRRRGSWLEDILEGLGGDD